MPVNDDAEFGSVEASTVSDELKSFYQRSAAAVIVTAVVAAMLIILFYILAHAGDQKVSVPDFFSWAANWHRTVGKEIDVLTAAPAVAAVVLAVWIANALASPTDDDQDSAKERARHLMLDLVTTRATFGGSLALWCLALAAGLGQRGLIGAVVAGVLAFFCSALTPLAKDRADAHRVAISETERRLTRLRADHHHLPILKESTVPRWARPLRTLPWSIPAFLAIIVAVLIVLITYYGGTDLWWWAVLLIAAIGCLVEWVWAYVVLLQLTAWSVRRASQGWFILLTYVFGLVGSVMYLLALLVAITSSTSSVGPFIVALIAYLLPAGAWVIVRRGGRMSQLKAVYFAREERTLNLAIATETRKLEAAGVLGRRRLEDDLVQLLREVQELTSAATAPRRRWPFSRRQG